MSAYLAACLDLSGHVVIVRCGRHCEKGLGTCPVIVCYIAELLGGLRARRWVGLNVGNRSDGLADSLSVFDQGTNSVIAVADDPEIGIAIDVDLWKRVSGYKSALVSGNSLDRESGLAGG